MAKEAQQQSLLYTVLYIEDDPFNRELVGYIYKRRPEILLIEAENGATGIESAQNNSPDIILLDLNLPDQDGYAVLKHLLGNQITCSIPVIALTGNSSLEEEKKSLDAGFFGYLTKPIDIEKLYSMTDAALAARVTQKKQPGPR